MNLEIAEQPLTEVIHFTINIGFRLTLIKAQIRANNETSVVIKLNHVLDFNIVATLDNLRIEATTGRTGVIGHQIIQPPQNSSLLCTTRTTTRTRGQGVLQRILCRIDIPTIKFKQVSHLTTEQQATGFRQKLQPADKETSGQLVFGFLVLTVGLHFQLVALGYLPVPAQMSKGFLGTVFRQHGEIGEIFKIGALGWQVQGALRPSRHELQRVTFIDFDMRTQVDGLYRLRVAARFAAERFGVTGIMSGRYCHPRRHTILAVRRADTPVTHFVVTAAHRNAGT